MRALLRLLIMIYIPNFLQNIGMRDKAYRLTHAVAIGKHPLSIKIQVNGIVFLSLPVI